MSDYNETLAQDAEANGWFETAKLHRLEGENQTVGAFLEWLGSSGYLICEYLHLEGNSWGDYYPTSKRVEELIAEFFDIDYKRYNEEREEMYKALVNANNK